MRQPGGSKMLLKDLFVETKEAEKCAFEVFPLQEGKRKLFK